VELQARVRSFTRQELCSLQCHVGIKSVRAELAGNYWTGKLSSDIELERGVLVLGRSGEGKKVHRRRR